MFDEQKILAVVPARGGSKGIPLKNLATIGDRSLISIVAEVVGECGFFEAAIVSTDHADIAEESERAGLSVPFLRPPEISGDRISDVVVLTHALLAMEELTSKHYDIVVMLQPTSPFRRPVHCEQVIERLISGKYDSVLTVSETDTKCHPLKQLILNDDRVQYYDDRGSEIIARQQLTPVYQRNGFAYALQRSCLVDQQAIIGKNCSAVVTTDRFVNIDSFEDLSLARYYAQSIV